MSQAWRARLFSYGIVVPFAFLLAVPFIWMVFTSLKSQAGVFDLSKSPFSFHGDNLHSWGFLFHHTLYLHWLGNTALVGAAVVAITLVLALPAGYALARLSGRFGQGLGVAIFLTYLVPPTLLFLPLTRVVSKIHLTDTLTSLILVYPSFTVP